jgi:hypothetical protein
MTPRIFKLAADCDRIKERIERKVRRHESTSDDFAKLRAKRLTQLKAENRAAKKQVAA